MKLLTTIALLLITGSAFAQTSPTPTPTQPSIESQIAEVGCRAERQAAAATIVDLQKKINDLQEQLKAAPPKPTLDKPPK